MIRIPSRRWRWLLRWWYREDLYWRRWGRAFKRIEGRIRKHRAKWAVEQYIKQQAQEQP
jgi:hypothetical protein